MYMNIKFYENDKEIKVVNNEFIVLNKLTIIVKSWDKIICFVDGKEITGERVNDLVIFKDSENLTFDQRFSNLSYDSDVKKRGTIKINNEIFYYNKRGKNVKRFNN